MLFRYSKDKKGRLLKKAVIYTKEEHGIKLNEVDSDALRIITHLRESGFMAYLVGGAVRDLIVGKKPKDFDIVTSATPSRIKKLFRNSRIIGRRFRLVHVFFGDKIFEVSTFRSIKDGSVGNAFGTIDEDVMRRDFTLNALYYDPLEEQIIDYMGGVQDIKKAVIRPVIPMDKIFVEDPVRMLRAVKYAATTGCHMSWFLKRKIRKSAHLLSPVSPSRLTEELLKIINSGHAYEIVSQALATDLYMYLQPTATAMMYSNHSFEKKYLESLKALDELVSKKHDARLGEKLVYLVYDFIAGLTDWSKEVQYTPAAGELYVKTWRDCRNFILPMNPQRSELEYAIRVSLKKLGVSVRMSSGELRAATKMKNMKTSNSEKSVAVAAN
ncbi:MAG: polynucleotide adenylyltransferase PcnB [Treponema sp.]|nr:polynucleotide adenylyltransferase PcnB [Treponema sp.]